jgi:ArsR family transcriptional regulator
LDSILQATKATADANRLRLLRVLSGGPFNVAELTEILGLGQSTVSRHLRILSDAGLVSVRRSGTWAYYSLQAPESNGFSTRLLSLLIEELSSVENGDGARIERVLARRRHATSVFFRDAARDWDRRRDATLGPPTHTERMLELVGEGGTVVDLGTGTGVLLQSLARAADRVIGVDASPEMLEHARRRVRQGDLPNTELRLGAFEHLPLSDGEADAMVANLVLHHVADVPQVLREIRRGLAEGGRLLIAELEEHDHETFWLSLGAQWPGFRPEEIRGWLDAAGFDEVRCERGRREPEGDRPGVFLMEAVLRIA